MKKDNTGFEERADFLNDEDLIKLTVSNDYFEGIQEKIIEKGAKLIVGPRGTGKTHQLRYANDKCLNDPKQPLPIYVNFGKYYHLEPLLFNSSNAIRIFHTWVLAKIIFSCYDVIEFFEIKEEFQFLEDPKFSKENIKEFIGQAEKFNTIPEHDDLIKALSIQKISDFLEEMAFVLKRKRVILLLDDAALTLTPDYLIEFFEIFRSLKTPKISPKASVYPGTTQYGPSFHIGHDAEQVFVWLSIENEQYSTFMDNLVALRLHIKDEINSDILELLKYSSFGIPRTFIALVREFIRLKTIKSTQQRFNTVLSNQAELIRQEYNSLSIKLPQYKSIIEVGIKLFDNTIEELVEANKGKRKEKQITIGIENNVSIYKLNRMIKFLIEAGLFFEMTPLNDGPNKIYDRYIPHFLFLIQKRAFSHTKGFNAKSIVEYIKSKTDKRPLRRQISSIIDVSDVQNIKLNLPSCSNCGTERLTEEQKFCHNCGSALVGKSAFEEYLKIRISDLPITNWQKRKISEETDFATVGDILLSPTPATDLRKAYGIGKVKSNKIYSVVTALVDEFIG